MPSEVSAVSWEVSTRRVCWVCQVFPGRCLSVLSPRCCAVQRGLPWVGALLWRALNEIVGAAGKMPQDLSEAERVHTLGCKT